MKQDGRQGEPGLRPLDMVERVAAAIRDYEGAGDRVECYFDTARAAIQAMREPTEAMLEEISQVLAAAREGFWHPSDTEETVALYRRLIDSALQTSEASGSPNPTEERGGE